MPNDTDPASTERQRCLAVIDQVIGAAEASKRPAWAREHHAAPWLRAVRDAIASGEDPRQAQAEESA